MEDEEPKKIPPKKLDPLSDAFGIQPMDGQLRKSGKFIVPDPIDDYQYGRQNIIDLIEKGNQYLHSFGEVAISAQEPRHFEVLTNMLNSLIEANEKLMLMKKHDQDIRAKETKEDPTQTINNNLFVGSTSELQTMIANLSKKKPDDQS